MTVEEVNVLTIVDLRLVHTALMNDADEISDTQMWTWCLLQWTGGPRQRTCKLLTTECLQGLEGGMVRKPQMATVTSLPASLGTEDAQLFRRPILPSPDPDLNVFSVLEHQVPGGNAAACVSESYLFRRLTVTTDCVGVQYGHRVAAYIRGILK